MIGWFKGFNSSKDTTTASNKQEDNFLSLATHELRSPLSVIKWYAEILLDGDIGTLNEEQIRYLKTIQTSNQRAIDLIRSLLNVSRLDLGTFCIKPVQCNVAGIVRSVVGEFDQRIKDGGIVLDQGGVPETLMVDVDKQIYSIIVRNVLANAALFTKQGGTITVSLRETSKGEMVSDRKIEVDSILLTVRDTGIGIAEEDKEKIFSKMFRGSNVSDADGSGSGLGLYIVNKVVSYIGGNIWCDSIKGKGSTFYVSLPRSGMPSKEGSVTLD